MNIYFSGINGTGIGPLALLAADAGFKVFGSDLNRGAIYDDIVASGAEFRIGKQDEQFLQHVHNTHGVDWLVYTSALPDSHPELTLAEKLGIKTTKRDDLMNYIIEEKGLKLIAVAGTHGKTTTTAMLVWVFKQLGLPLSYVVGTTLPFASSGHFNQGAKYIAYECDEYDRNFLKFNPELALITTVSYDHIDIYPTEANYKQAFKQFEAQSSKVIQSAKLSMNSSLNLPGSHNRENANLVLAALKQLNVLQVPYLQKAVDILNKFPGSNRRFERLMDGLYTDYAHHPDEVAATVQMALEVSDKVAVIYQPHQNTRQHQVREGYKNAFNGVNKLFWLPTYLAREDPSLPVISPAEFIAELSNKSIARPADINDELLANIKQLINNGYLVLLMAAGPADNWLRGHLAGLKN
ncbi:MAG: Mur ligase domain-containing protein [Candidatus Nomurabacteria bacterium]|jgi:UDP-N-acetylmuramate--alanine ligase|nr:Mur ligase domain-containing protein [Candidatus Nomurabacteria bacterium]